MFGCEIRQCLRRSSRCFFCYRLSSHNRDKDSLKVTTHRHAHREDKCLQEIFSLLKRYALDSGLSTFFLAILVGNITCTVSYSMQAMIFRVF